MRRRRSTATRLEEAARLLGLTPGLPARVERVDRPLRDGPLIGRRRLGSTAAEATRPRLTLVERVDRTAHLGRATAPRLLLPLLLLLRRLRRFRSLFGLPAAATMPGPVEQRPPARGWFRRPAPAGLGPVHGSSSLRLPDCHPRRWLSLRAMFSPHDRLRTRPYSGHRPTAHPRVILDHIAARWSCTCIHPNVSVSENLTAGYLGGGAVPVANRTRVRRRGYGKRCLGGEYGPRCDGSRTFG